MFFNLLLLHAQKKNQEKGSLMLRQLLNIGKKARNSFFRNSSSFVGGQFRLSLRFFASLNLPAGKAGTPTPQRHSLKPLFEHAPKPSLTKRDIKSDVFEQSELSTYTSDLSRVGSTVRRQLWRYLFCKR